MVKESCNLTISRNPFNMNELQYLYIILSTVTISWAIYCTARLHYMFVGSSDSPQPLLINYQSFTKQKKQYHTTESSISIFKQLHYPKSPSPQRNYLGYFNHILLSKCTLWYTSAPTCKRKSNICWERWKRILIYQEHLGKVY